jgi:hypothetical protein
VSSTGEIHHGSLTILGDTHSLRDKGQHGVKVGMQCIRR